MSSQVSSPAPRDARLGETIDLVADLNAQDDDGFGWSLLSRAADPLLARLVSLTRRPAGVKVHLEVLPSGPVAEI
jgi:hypothetical protein